MRTFERELGDRPASAFLDAGPSSIRFEQLELMDEAEVQMRISAVRGLQQALVETEHELTELNTLVSSILGYDQVRPERNPFRPEIFVDALQSLLGELDVSTTLQAQCRQTLVPLLGKALRPVYLDLLAYLRAQRVQPVRYVVHRGPVAGLVGNPGASRGGAREASLPAAPVVASARMPLQAGSAGLAQQVYAGHLTVQQLHGLVSGGSRQDAAELVREVVNLIIANITEDERLLPPVRELIRGLGPALMQLALADLHFFSDKQHPARLLLEEIAQHSFAYDSISAEGFTVFMDALEIPLRAISPTTASPEAFDRVLQQLRQGWDRAGQQQERKRQAAVQALQQAEKRNELAQQIADHIRKQPGTVLVHDLVVDFACGPWAQVMAQAQMEGAVDRPGEPDVVALLEDLFWSVRPDQTRQQPAQLVKLIPQLVQGLRQGLQRIHFPEEQAQEFFAQLFALHQGGLEGISAVRNLRAAPQPATATWLAPEEARDSGFMDDLGGEPPVFEATAPAGLPAEFPATEPMPLVDRGSETGQQALEPAQAVTKVTLDELQPGNWVELLVSGQWTRLQLSWRSENATLCLFSSAGGSNHSMTRRMFDRLVNQGHLRLVAQGAVVERAFDAVAEMAMRNSVYMDIQADPPGA
jgi:hypothetical protein